ncbi:Ycf66 family protein [Microcoleus sp. D2_18a_B4]|uniref:Ycf66 family protein n=1 Tax=Microcoleus sp. D2_18a_B4 TaxID=3055329 RepID=UPI002FD6F580
MLAYILALAVGLGSFSIYMAAFFFPEVHRKSDFTWSGVGLFYALILWACAGRITGALLLGQMAGVAMLGWFAWETLTLRRQVTPVAEQTPIPQSANLAAGGVPFAGLFAKKKEPAAAKKPKFVRSPKPKTDVVPAPTLDKGEVKLEEQPAITPIAESIAESAIDEATAESAIAPDLKIPDSKTPAIAEIPVFSVETPAAETSQPPAELASNFTPLPLPLEISEIAVAPSVEPVEAQPEPQQQPEVDDFDEETEWRTAVKESQAAAAAAAAPTAAPTPPTPPKPAKKAGGFGSLFDNIKNSLGGMLGLGAGKNKSDATPQTPKPSATPESIAPESKITPTPAPGIDQILESELAQAAAEVAAESSNTPVETSLGVPFPTNVEAMAALMATETASSDKIGETPIEDRSSAQIQTPLAAIGEPEAAAGVPEAEAPALSVETQTPLAAVGEPEAAGVPEAEAPAVSLEMTVVEMAEPVEIEVPGEPGLSVQVETVSVSVISIESTDKTPSSEGEQPELIRPNPPPSTDKTPSSEGEQPELIRPNPPPSELVEAARVADESKSENVSGEDKPSS